MPARSLKEVFVFLLSNLRYSSEKSAQFYWEASQAVQDIELGEALEARALVSRQNLTGLNQCFNLIQENPVPVRGDLYDIFLDTFRSELATIDAGVGRQLFILAQAVLWTELVAAEYVSLVAAAGVTGHYGVSVLLESGLADRLAFVEEDRRLISRMFDERPAA